MPTVYKYCLIVSETSPTGYLFYPTEELEIEYEHYDKWELADEAVHRFDITEPLGYTYLCSNPENLKYFIAGLNNGISIIHDHGLCRQRLMTTLTKGVPQG